MDEVESGLLLSPDTDEEDEDSKCLLSGVEDLSPPLLLWVETVAGLDPDSINTILYYTALHYTALQPSSALTLPCHSSTQKQLIRPDLT
jgi:hypothetical protein